MMSSRGFRCYMPRLVADLGPGELTCGVGSTVLGAHQLALVGQVREILALHRAHYVALARCVGVGGLLVRLRRVLHILLLSFGRSIWLRGRRVRSLLLWRAHAMLIGVLRRVLALSVKLLSRGLVLLRVLRLRVLRLNGTGSWLLLHLRFHLVGVLSRRWGCGGRCCEWEASFLAAAQVIHQSPCERGDEQQPRPPVITTLIVSRGAPRLTRPKHPSQQRRSTHPVQTRRESRFLVSFGSRSPRRLSCRRRGIG